MPDQFSHTSPPPTTFAVKSLFSLTATEYEHRDVVVDFSTGERVRCRVPELWSDNAAATLMSKYAVRAGVPDEMGGVNGREVDAERIFDRLVAGWRAAAIEHGYWHEDDPNLAVFCAEIKAMLEQQVAAPNSPQWFNTGVAVQYGIQAGSDGHYYATVNDYGDAAAHACKDSLTHPQISACFIQSVEDSLVGDGGIMDLWQREARLFKYGSGSGANYSALRGKGEPLSRGGASSGLLSFLRVGDRSAGAIKSGGTCLAPWQHVYTERGPIPVKELADKGEDFIVLSYDPPAGRYKAKAARAWKSGHKPLACITTDKGKFYLTPDHPVRLSCGAVRLAGDLEPGNSLFRCSVDSQQGYTRVHLRDGKQGKGRMHRMVMSDVLKQDVRGLSVHHLDGDKRNNAPSNLEVLTQAEHAGQHGRELAAEGAHIFQKRRFSQAGARNGMHANAAFWEDPEKVQAFKKAQSKALSRSGRAPRMARAANRQRMLNTAFKVLNSGHSIDTFEDYVAGRKKVVGRIPSIRQLKQSINQKFGSYPAFVQAVADNNHRVVSVEYLAPVDVYDVEVDCPTPDDKSPESGHTFVIWPDSEHVGSGIVVFNTRRSARMVIVDVDHPDVEDFIAWKPREDSKIRVLHEAGIGDASSFEDEATETVSGQNANNSVAVSDAFMHRVMTGMEWELRARTDNRVVKTVQARELWGKIAQAAWECADPGLQFADTINEWHTCKSDGPIRGSNPCQPAFAPVLTPDGIRTMGDIEVGDTVWSGKQWTKVKRKIATGVKPVHVYHTTAGRVISTAEHRVFQQGERVPAAQAETIDVAFGPATDAALVEPTDPQDVMDGLYFGDGSYRADAAEGQRCMLAIGKNDGCYHTSEVSHLITRAKPGYNYCSWAVQSTIGPLPYTYERVVPEQFYTGNIRRVRGFLRGLYSANGSIVGRGKCGRVTLKAASFAVICAAQEMLSALGIRSYYTTNKANEVEFANGTYLCKQSYDLNITSDVKRFAQLVGFVHPYKSEKLQTLVEARAAVGQSKYATRKGKTTYEVKHVEDLGGMPVFDIEVEADEHAYWSGGHLISNCSEYVFLDDTACNLASLNLAKFHVPVSNAFAWKSFEHAARLWTIVLDISVSMAGYPTAEIARRSMFYRTLGLGYAALGELLVLLGLGYGTEEGRAFAAKVTSLLTATAYCTSAELASVLGPFPQFAANRESALEVLEKHTSYASEKDIACWELVERQVRKHGLRNAQVTLLAPCGTIGIVMDCETTGVEPFYSDTTVKTLAGGGVMRLASKRFAEVMLRAGFEPADHMQQAWTVENGRVLEYAWVEPPAALDDVLVCASDLTPRQHIDMMAAVQPFLSSAISKTVNCPSEITPDEVAELYMYAWEEGLKSIAIYRDGCKPAQPLQGRKPPPGAQAYSSREAAELAASTVGPAAADLGKAAVAAAASFEKLGARLAGAESSKRRGERVHPPSTARSVRTRVELSGHTFYLICGEHDDGSLAEVFVVCPRTGSAMSGWVNAWAKTFSLGLQHGTPLEVLVDAMRGETFDPAGFHDGRSVMSPVDAFARIIEARYVSEEPRSTDEPALTREGLDYELAMTRQAIAEHEALTASGEADGDVHEILKSLRSTLGVLEVERARLTPSSNRAPRATGQTCTRCGGMQLERSGSCYVCRTCGETTGCS